MVAQYIQGSEFYPQHHILKSPEFDPQRQIFQIFCNTCEVNFTKYYDISETMISISDFVLRMRRNYWPLERG